ncbi:retrotransposon protein, putative, ty1-copia subclass [Tanacetum coccineum]
MLQELKALYSKQAEQELLQTVREFHACKQKEGQSVSSYVLKMKSYIDNLERLGQPVTQSLATSLILVSLSNDYDSFVKNYNMHDMGMTVNELHDMLKLHEETLPKKDANPALHAIRSGKVQKNQNKKLHKAAKKGKMGYAPNNVPFTPKPKTPPPTKKDNPAKDAICHQCGEGLRGSKKLKPGALSLYVGNGNRATVEAIGSYHLELPSGLVIVLNNCHYAPSIIRDVISVSRLHDDGFINRFDENNVLLVSKNNLVYFVAVPRDGIFEINMSCSNTNDSSMYNVSNKRAKINLDSSYLWHCRLGHISKKRIDKLHHEGLLNSTDIQSLGKYVACMFGKMARKPYSHQVEMAKDLLVLIHTDVYGPFKIMPRQGASYFVTFTDDCSRVLVHLKKHGIIAHRTPPYTPQNNGVFERRNRTLLDMVRSMMSQTTLPKYFWDYALKTAARILNMVPSKKVDKTPYEVWHGQAPKLSYLKNVEFFESKLIDLKASGSVEDLEIIQEEDTNPSVDTSLDHEEDDQEIDEPQSDINPIRKSSRTRRAPDRMCLYMDAEEHELRDLGELANYKAALLDPESKKWLDAMNVEMQSMKENDVWVLVELPPNARTVGSKWLFKKKTDMDGAVYVFKAPFLNGHLSEEVYMEQPQGFVDPKYPNHVCKLKRSIYGLKQESRQWNKRFDDEIKKFGFTQNHDEPCVYLKASGSYIAILILYVDDILLTGNNIPMLQDVKSYLGKCFAMKDLGDVAYILGIKIYRDRSKRLIGLCQSAYIEKILKRYSMKNSKRGTIPMQEKLRLSIYTRPDVTFAQNMTSRFQQNPSEIHWTTVKNILKYLWNTKDMFLVYGGNMERELRVSCYTDAGYLTDADTLRSQTGYVFVLNGGAVD